MKYAVLLILSAVFAAMVYVRFAPVDFEHYITDPDVADAPGTKGVVLRQGGELEPPVFAIPAKDLLKALDRVIMATPRTQRLSSSKFPDVRAYVTRSRIWQFPDVTSVKVIAIDDQTSSFRIFARQVYGAADLGVNQARVENWLAQLR